MVSVTLAPLLCGANHLPYIVLSFISDPYHAGSISIGYFITFLLLYFMYVQFYSRVVLRTGSRPKNYPYATNPDIVHYPDGDACRRVVRVPFNTQVVMLSLVVVTPLVLFYEFILIILLWALPITKTLEDSPTRLYTIYQGTGILIVALLSYNIILRPSPFSLAGTLDKLGRQLQIPEKIGRKWVRMGDEEKAATVIRTLYALKDSEQPPPASPVLVAEIPDGGGAYHQGSENIAMEDVQSTAADRAKENETTEEAKENEAEMEVVISKV